VLLDDPGRVRSQITNVVCQIQRFDFDCNLVVSRKVIIRTRAPLDLRLKPLLLNLVVGSISLLNLQLYIFFRNRRVYYSQRELTSGRHIQSFFKNTGARQRAWFLPSGPLQGFNPYHLY
jgi:hypothetical protein